MISAPHYGEIQQLIHTFWARVDRNDTEAVLALLAPDCRWTRAGRLLEGRAAISDALAYPRSPKLFVRHLAAGLVAEETAEGVECRYALTAWSNLEEGERPPYPLSAPVRIYDYVSLCVSTSDGWRLGKLYGEAVFER